MLCIPEISTAFIPERNKVLISIYKGTEQHCAMTSAHKK